MASDLANYGVLGVGSLASAIVSGLCDGADDPPSVVLSPRNAETAAALAGRFPTVTVAADNQAVVDDSTTVIVCLRPAHVDLLGDLAWRTDHVVVSAVAGLPLTRLAGLVAPAGQVARAVPMPAVSTRASVTPVHPPLAPVVELFDRLGGTLPIEGGHQFEAVFTASGTVAPFFEYLGVLARFLTAHGLPAPIAQRFVADTFAGVVAPLADAENPELAELVSGYAPPGGGNAQLMALLDEAGVFDSIRRALDTVHQQLTSVDRPASYGVLGVGSIARAIVTGLSHEVSDPPRVLLSPRSTSTSSELAERFPTVSVAPDNQAVLDGSPIVIVCVPSAAAGMLDELTWRADHVVVSAVAGVGMPRLTALVAPATRVCRSVPMPAVAQRAGLTAVHPPLAEARALFDRLGSTLEVSDVVAYESLSATSATLAGFFEYLRSQSDWLEERGIPARDARRYVAATYAGALGSLHAPDPDFGELAGEYATPGGVNEQVARELTEHGTFDELRSALDRALHRLTT